MGSLALLAEPGKLGLATDLYQLTMAAAFHAEGMGDRAATFELFVRRLPPTRGYLVAAGLEQAVAYLRALSFDSESLAYLRGLPMFRGVADSFFAELARFRFRCDVAAMPEGTVAFAGEPLIQVRGPLIQAQLVETFLLATVNHQTAIASKAARVVEAAQGRSVVDFGARRAHGFDAAIYGARAAAIGGCVGTSNVIAARQFGLEAYGTAAHSFTMAFEREEDAFRCFHRVFPGHAVLLVDTYDTLVGTRRAAAIGPGLRGIRLDSGDLLTLSREARRILDDAGMPETRILASGDLDEERVDALVRAGAQIDSFGVGTAMITSLDAPALGGVYKLVEIERDGTLAAVRKLSADKATLPGAKQVFRQRRPDGQLSRDMLGLAGERLAGEPLLVPVMRNGEEVGTPPAVAEIRERARTQIAALPERTRRLTRPVPVVPELSERLAAETARWSCPS